MGAAVRVYDRREARWNEVRRAPVDACGCVASPLDAPVGEHSGRRRRGTLRELFALMRERGLTPHPAGPAADESVASLIMGTTSEGVPTAVGVAPGAVGYIKLRTAGSHLGMPGLLGGAGQGDLAPNPTFGVTELDCPTDKICAGATGDFDCDGQYALIFGKYAQLVKDVAAMGGGVVRRVKKCDLLWGSLFPEDATEKLSYDFGQRVPRPDAILQWIRAHDYAALAPFAALLAQCHSSTVKVAVTPFNSGGGSLLTGQRAKLTSQSQPFGFYAGDTWELILEAKPSHKSGVRLVSARGWDPFYWDLPSGTSSQQAFQRYCIQVWPAREADGDGFTEYERECSRRKSLAIAAFASGVAEWMALAHSVYLEWLGGNGLYDVIDCVELGNELDGTAAIPLNTLYERSTTKAPDLAESATFADWSAREIGRYMALIAAPIRRALPAMRFSAPELLSWSPPLLYGSDPCFAYDRFSDRADWLALVIGVGLEAEVDLQRSLQWGSLRGSSTTEVQEWSTTCAAAGFYWPPSPTSTRDISPLRATDLVHMVGFHFYHGYTHHQVAGGRDTYQFLAQYADSWRLAADLDTLTNRVIRPLAESGFALEPSVGEIAFPADYRGTVVVDMAPYYEGTTEKFQAAMLVRYLATLGAAGVRRACWFTLYLDPKGVDSSGHAYPWNSQYEQTGLRNDKFATRTQYEHFQGRGAYPRPAWYAFRRLMWLYAVSRTCSLVANDAGLMIIRFTFAAGISTGPEGEDLGGIYRYAYLMWIDQFADSTCLHWNSTGNPEAGPLTAVVTLLETGETPPTFLSVVPEVTPDPSPGADDNGFMLPADVEWNWNGAFWALDRSDDYVDDSGIRFTQLAIKAADPQSAPAPLCVLTNAQQALWNER